MQNNTSELIPNEVIAIIKRMQEEKKAQGFDFFKEAVRLKIYEREALISNELRDEGVYTVKCAGTDITLHCELKDEECNECFISAYNESKREFVDYKTIDFTSAFKLLAFEEEAFEEKLYSDCIASELTSEMCYEALNTPFLKKF